MLVCYSNNLVNTTVARSEFADSLGCWLLVIGYWLLVTGYWLLVISYPRAQSPEPRAQSPERQ